MSVQTLAGVPAPLQRDPQQATYRYLLCDLLTDQPVVQLPLAGVSFDRRISRTGSLKGKLTATNAELVRIARLARAYTGRGALYVFRNGQLWWGGIPWTVQAKQGSRGGIDVDVQAATFDSYAHHRILRADLDYVDTDQGVIIPALWRHMQSDPRGNIGVAAVDQPTGTPRERHYEAGDAESYGKLIEDLGDVDGGPEHTVDVYLDSAGIRRKRLRVGQRLGATEARAVFPRGRHAGGKVLGWEDTADAVDGGTAFQVRGEDRNGNVGKAKGPLMSDVYEATELLLNGWPLLDVTDDHTDVSRQSTLNAYARALRDEYAGAVDTYGYTVTVGDSAWSPNNLGDTVRLKLHDLWHDRLDAEVRPVACKVTAADRDQTESVELIFGED